MGKVECCCYGKIVTVVKAAEWVGREVLALPNLELFEDPEFGDANLMAEKDDGEASRLFKAAARSHEAVMGVWMVLIIEGSG